MAILAVIVVIIGAILLMTNRGSSPQLQPGAVRVDLAEYIDKPSTVAYTTEGGLNSEEDHRAVRISVNRNLRTVQVLSGYNYSVINAQDFPNTQAAYDEFMHGLKNAGFTQQQKAAFSDEKGVCPLGTRYIYRLQDDSGEVLRLWSTSCARKDGSSIGNAFLIKQLFQKQIPGYTNIVKGVKL